MFFIPKFLHSKFTALTCVLNDILLSLDQCRSVFLELLDLSTVFDTVDHQMLLDCLATRIGVGGVVLDLAQSYLLSRTQLVSISDARSES